MHTPTVTNIAKACKTHENIEKLEMSNKVENACKMFKSPIYVNDVVSVNMFHQENKAKLNSAERILVQSCTTSRTLLSD